MSSPKLWNQLVLHQVKCMSAPKHLHLESLTRCLPAFLKLRTVFQRWMADFYKLKSHICEVYSLNHRIKGVTISARSSNRYIIRLKELEGILNQDNVCAYDVMMGLDLAIKLNTELRKWSYLIFSILQEVWDISRSIGLVKLFSKASFQFTRYTKESRKYCNWAWSKSLARVVHKRLSV